MKDLKPLIILAALIAVALAGGLIIMHKVSSLVKGHVPQAFDDSDLILARAEVPAESNAFSILLEATDKLYWPRSLQVKLRDMSVNSNWDDSLAAEVLDKNRACMDLFDQLMQKPFLQIPEPKALDEKFPYLSDCRGISYVAAVRTSASFRAKREHEAFNEAFEIISFGHRVEDSGGGYIHYLVGSSIKSVGLMQIRQMIAQTTLADAQLAGFVRDLDDFKPSTTGFTNAVKVEYKTVCGFLDDFAKGKIPSTTNSALEEIGISIGMKRLFDATETKRKFAQTDRILLGGFPKPYGEIDWSSLPVVETNTSFLSSVRRAINGNALGDILFEMLCPSAKSLSSRKSREDVDVTATQLLLALKIYNMRHGKPAELLSELVPEELSQIPMDDFDSKPIRYVPDQKLIYSVGSDLNDDGGEGNHKDFKSYDIPFNIEF